MFQRPILMNEADGSPGGGSPQPSAPNTSAEPNANQGTPAPFSIDDIRAAVAQTVAEKFQEQANGFFANARKAGLLKQDKPIPPIAASAPPVEANNATGGPGVTSTDVQQMLARQRAFDRAVGSASLNDRQLARMEEAFAAVNPPDPASWARGYLEDLGIGKRNDPQPVTATNNDSSKATQAPADKPAPVQVPQLGAPAPGDQRDPEAILISRPLEATAHDFERLVAVHGKAKALEMWQRHMNAYLSTVKVLPDSRRQR